MLLSFIVSRVKLPGGPLDLSRQTKASCDRPVFYSTPLES